MVVINHKTEKQHTKHICKNQDKKDPAYTYLVFQADMSQVGGKKGRAWVVAEGEKIFPFPSADFSIAI